MSGIGSFIPDKYLEAYCENYNPKPIENAREEFGRNIKKLLEEDTKLREIFGRVN